jgi:hypothetical protein
MLHRAFQQIGDGFHASMRMHREAREVIGRIIRTKGIQQEEGVETFGYLFSSEDPLQPYSCSVTSGLPTNGKFCLTY